MNPDSLSDDHGPAERQGAGADPAKTRQILEGARQVFMTLGFDGASMGDIARAAGVSKGTLYVYFDSKERLFAALIADERKQYKRDIQLDPDDPDIAGQLRRFFVALVAFVTSARNIQSVRTVMAIAERIPEIGQEFYRDGPFRGLTYFTGYLEAHVRAGRLAIDDCALAARQFQVLVTAGILAELLYGVRTTPDDEEIARTVDAAIAMFLARYGAKGNTDR